MTSKTWRVAEPVSQEVQESFPEIDPILLQLLWNRGLQTQEAIDEFLNPDWKQGVYDPYLFRDMQRAVERIYESIGANQKIAVFGDYDADGVTAAAILSETLKRLGADTEVYLPHREREGYGLNEGAIKYLAEKGAKLLITCDCGIANVAQVAAANVAGFDVIITDHHQPQDELPKAFAILHPGLEGETYPWKYLSGGGVAFKLMQGLLRYDGCHLAEREREAHEKWLLDLVAISTVADMVKLQGESRTLVKYGLTVLQKTRRLGLRKLIEAAGLRLDTLDTYSISFQIAPRINAAGRMDHANAAYALLTAGDETQAGELARALNLTNAERQRVTDEMFVASKAQIGELIANQYFVHSFEPSWQLGMVGLVAGKLVQEYGRPALVMCQQGDRIAGSGRAGVGGFDLAGALSACRKHLTSWGGHREAAGFSLPRVSFEAFLVDFTAEVERQLRGVDLAPVVNVDMVLPFETADWSLVERVKKLEPTGQGNMPPRFASLGLRIGELTPVGAQGQHLKIVLEGGGATRKLILFRQGEVGNELTVGNIVDVVYQVGVNEWNGNRELELKVIDIKKSSGVE